MAGAMRSGAFAAGDLVLFVSYVVPLGWMAREFSNLILDAQRTAVSFERMEALMVDAPAGTLVAHKELHLRNQPPTVLRPSRTPADHLDMLSVRGLTCLHAENRRGIHDVDLDHPPRRD